MCKFAHIRPRVDGVIPPCGGVTVAYEDIGNGVYLYTLAKCAPHDNFQKRLGRVKAKGRMNSEKYHNYIDGIKSDKEFVAYVAYSLEHPASL